MDRKALRFILGRLVKAGQRVCRGDSATINEVSSLVSTVTENMIGNLPPVELCTLQAAPVLYTAVFESSIIHASIFGFSRAHEVIPLHDHPQMHGFIKVLRGSLKVTSFSFLDHSGKHWSGQNKVRFEEERVVTSKDGCIHLQPFKGNIHEVRALEDGSFFFDTLIPGYGDDIKCSYYEQPQGHPSVGDICFLREIPCPKQYFCYSLSYDTLKKL